MNILKISLLLALFFSALAFFYPKRPILQISKDIIEINYMGPDGPISGAIEDAVRAFEKESERAHALDPSKPRYRVISGQNASRDQVSDPTRFLLSVAGGMPPDVITFDRFAVSEWASRGTFTPLDSFLITDSLAQVADRIQPADYFKSAWDEAVYTDPVTGRSRLYSIPIGVDDRVLFYNKDLLKRGGFVDEKGEARPPKTWEELEEMAVKLTERDEKGHIVRLGFAPGWGNIFLYIYGWMNGGEFMSADGKHCTLNDPRVVAALEYMTRLYDKLGGAQAVAAFQSSFQAGNLDPFITGKLAMKIDYMVVLNTSLGRYGRSLNYGASMPPMPAAELARGRHPITMNGGWAYAIPSTAHQKKAAWDFIRFMSSERAQLIITESDRLTLKSQGFLYVPVQSANERINTLIFDKYVFNNPTIDSKLKDAARVFNDLLPYARYRPVTPVGQVLWNQHLSATENAIFHKRTPKAALDYSTAYVQRELDKVLKPPQGRPVRWSWFFVLYAGLLIAAIVGVYFWDTRMDLRRKVGQMVRGLKAEKAGTTLEGIKGAKFFRAEWRGGFICALPWIAGFIIFTGGPLLFSIVISFCNYDILNPARFLGLGNFKSMLTDDPLFWKSLTNTVYMALGIPTGMTLSLAIALLLNQKVRGVAVWRTLFYLPSIVPAVASIILWVWILNPTGGMLNGVLASFGITGPNWLQSESTSKISLIMMGLWGAGGGMIIWLAGLKNISSSYYEAASMDGANTWQKFTHITLPLLTPYIFFNLIMGLIGTFQIFTQAFIMTSGGPVHSTLFYAYHLFNNAFRYLNMGYAAAMAWFLFLIVFLLTLIQMKMSKRWVYYEGL